jgi:hypothetical protein
MNMNVPSLLWASSSSSSYCDFWKKVADADGARQTTRCDSECKRAACNGTNKTPEMNKRKKEEFASEVEQKDKLMKQTIFVSGSLMVTHGRVEFIFFEKE